MGVWRWGMLIFMSALILTGGLSGTYAIKGDDTPRVTVIFQFSNGESMSTMVVLPGDNHTALKATELACEELNLYLNYTWSTYGAFVNQIGWERNDFNEGYWWHLMVWENDSYAWAVSQIGASSLSLNYGDVIAWVYTVDDSNWRPYTDAYAQPGHYNVWATPRGNFNNTGIVRAEIYGKDVVWKFKGESPWGFSSTPVVAHGMIFIADSAGLYALNLNGSLIWNNSKGAAGGYGIASPVVYGNYVIIGTNDEYLRAFYTNNGTVAWEFYLGEDVTSSPVIGIVNKYPVVFVTTFSLNEPGKIYAVNLTNGYGLWNLTLFGSNYFGMPAITKGKIYVPIAGIEDNSYQWNPPYGIQCIDVYGHYLWNLTLESSIRSSVVIEDNTLYFVSVGGNLSALNLTTLTFKWNYTIGKSTVSPAVSNGIIYVANDNGNVYAIADNGNYASLLWESEVNGAVKASPLYANGKIVIVTDNPSSTIYVFTKDGSEVWNYTPEPENYIISSPAIADSYLLISSNNGYLYAFSDNSTLPRIEGIYEENAYVGKSIKILLETSRQYQAILYYRNVSGDRFQAIWMNYTGEKYVGYIPPQYLEGNVYYYITIVNSTGVVKTTKIHIITVSQEIPELEYYPLIIILVVMLIGIFKNIVRR